ncbi:hypothetical protein ACPEEZ_01365 [Frigoribacterium sp. 2-23]|uniref:hypothetical protein n=1 Tax=Frigoribacterium sp. 2-23 TaxID=3415006 RepID=UPI003C6F85AF
MKILAAVLSILITTGGIIGGAVLLAFVAPPGELWTLVLAGTAFALLLAGPLMIGSLLAAWDFRRDETSRRLLRRWCVAIGVVELVSVAAIVVASVANGTPAWIPALFIGTGAVLTVVAIVVGPALRRRDDATRPEATEWVPITRAEIRRKAMTIVATFVAFVVVGGIVAVVLALMFGDPAEDIGFGLTFAMVIAFYAGGVAAILATLSLNRALRESAGRDVALLTKVAKVVLRRKPLELDPHERAVALTYARIVAITLPFQLVYTGMLYAGLVMQQTVLVASGLGPLQIVVVVVLLAALAFVVTLTVQRVSRARRWVREHTEDVSTDAISESSTRAS